MKKTLRILLKILKWGLVAIFSFYFLGISIFGFKATDKNGSWSFYWSGIEALWDSDEEFGVWRNKKMFAELNGLDGPYIAKDSIYRIELDNKLYSKKLYKQDTFLVKVNNDSKDSFYIKIQESHQIEKERYQLPQKLIAISDIEGNFNAFSSFLKANKVINNNYDWIFDDGNLVLNGDFVDRGNDVTQLLWLIYKLDCQSKYYGGKVHFILGNHEIMNFQGNWSYNERKYIKSAQEISGFEDWDKAIQFMYSNKTELGYWLRTKNVIEKIGDYIFVHAGLNPEILVFDLDLHEINKITKENWDKNLYSNPEENDTANFLVGQKSPFWYRGMVSGYKYYDKIKKTELDKILKYYNAKKIVVGHTVVKDVSTDFNGNIIRIDIKHGKERGSGMTKGLLIENVTEYKIDDKGNKYVL